MTPTAVTLNSLHYSARLIVSLIAYLSVLNEILLFFYARSQLPMRGSPDND